MPGVVPIEFLCTLAFSLPSLSPNFCRPLAIIDPPLATFLTQAPQGPCLGLATYVPARTNQTRCQNPKRRVLILEKRTARLFVDRYFVLHLLFLIVCSYRPPLVPPLILLSVRLLWNTNPGCLPRKEASHLEVNTTATCEKPFPHPSFYSSRATHLETRLTDIATSLPPKDDILDKTLQYVTHRWGWILDWSTYATDDITSSLCARDTPPPHSRSCRHQYLRISLTTSPILLTLPN